MEKTVSPLELLSETIILDLTSVVDQSIVGIVLHGITDSNGNALSGDNDVAIGALLGDANQNRGVNRADSNNLRWHMGEPLNQESGNFVLDLNLNGAIDQADGTIVRRNARHRLPATSWR